MPDIPPVPNIPPLSSVQDPNTRAVLQALISGWRVRNGEVGEGDEKFLTVGDLKGAAAQTFGPGGALLASGGTKGNPGGKSVAALINGLIADITETRLWKLLGERIQQIEWMQTPEWFNQRFGAAIKTEQLLREKQGSYLAGEIRAAVARGDRSTAIARQSLIAEVNENFAKAEAVTTLQAEFDRNKALTQQKLNSLATADGVQSNAITTLQQSVGDTDAKAEEALTLATTIDGAVKGSWTVKFDIDGYVTGAGLAVENKSSEFMVRADRFVIGSPVDPAAPDRADIPFIVTTAPKVIGGVTYPPGTWIKTAFIADATIDNAKIKDLAVDTLKIAGNAVTIPQYARGDCGAIALAADPGDYTPFPPTGGTEILSFTTPAPADTVNNCIVFAGRTGIVGVGEARRIAIVVDGVVLWESGWSPFVGDFFTGMCVHYTGASKTYSIRAMGRGYDPAVTATSAFVSVLVIGVKR